MSRNSGTSSCLIVLWALAVPLAFEQQALAETTFRLPSEVVPAPAPPEFSLGLALWGLSGRGLYRKLQLSGQ